MEKNPEVEKNAVAPELEPQDSSSQEKSVFSKSDSGDQHNVRDALADVKSTGVARIEEVVKVSNIYERVILFFSIFLVAYVYGLGGTVHTTMITNATDAFGEIALQSSVNVISAVVAAAALPTVAKLSDVFGRLELVVVGVFFYVLGNIVCAAANNVGTLSGGQVLYTIGYTVLQIMLELLIADFTSVRSRVFFSYLPAVPFIINTWIGGNVNSAIVGNDNSSDNMWRWGFGMWCIIMPVLALPLIFTLGWLQFKAHKRGLMEKHPSVFSHHDSKSKFLIDLFWLIDIPGIILIVGVFILILYPLTLAGGQKSTWNTAKIIAPIVVGFCLIPVMVIYELWAPHPMVPFRKMGHRSILAPLGIALMLDFVWMMQGDYLYTMLQISYDFSVTAASRVASLYSFVSVIAGPITGVAIYFTRRIKIYVICGVSLFMVAFGLLYYFRGSGSDRSGVIGGQVVLGIAGGMFPYPAQAVIQAFVSHENLGVMTGLYLSFYNVGQAIGTSVSGAMYTQILPKEISNRLETSNSTLIEQAYGSPLTLLPEYPMGTSVRDSMVLAYRHVQRLLCVVGLCLIVLLLVCAFLLPNPILIDQRSLVEEDEDVSENDNRKFGKIIDALSVPPKKRVRPENQTKWQRFLDEMW